DKKVRDILEVVELSGYDKKYPSQLSGGQQQRVALARAIALEPDFFASLIEPLSALDAKVRLKLREQIKSLHRKLGITTIMVTHDQEEALCLADKMVVMNNGEVIQIGTPKEVYKSPK
ncbi:phosphonate ABC transporter ATP-binding protein, partial [Clostridioides difficile]